MKTAVCIIVLLVLLVLLFPKVFWAVHNAHTRKLRGSLIPGENDLEMFYGEDLHAPVESLELQMENGRTCMIFYPAALTEAEEHFPAVIWGNGTGNTWVNYEASLKSLASYGFVAVGCDDSNMGDGQALYENALFLRSLNEEPDSIFYGKLDTEHFGAAGHSQGACGAVNAATGYEESRTLFASLFTTSLPKLSMCEDRKNMKFAYWKYDVSAVSVPYFSTTGTGFLDSRWISPLDAMDENFARIPESTAAWAARQIGASHNIVNEYHGCGYFNAWFCYTLKNDGKAAKVFDDQGELEKNRSRWKNVRKNRGNHA